MLGGGGNDLLFELVDSAHYGVVRCNAAVVVVVGVAVVVVVAVEPSCCIDLRAIMMAEYYLVALLKVLLVEVVDAHHAFHLGGRSEKALVDFLQSTHTYRYFLAVQEQANCVCGGYANIYFYI